MQLCAFAHLLLLGIYSISTSSATPTPHDAYQDHAITVPKASRPSAYESSARHASSAPFVQKRRLYAMYPAKGWIVHYGLFNVYEVSQRTVDAMTYYWAHLVVEALGMKGEEFNEAIKVFTMGELHLQIFGMNGAVPQDFVVSLAEALLEWSIRGFCGLFNARVVIGEKVYWVVFGVKRD